MEILRARKPRLSLDLAPLIDVVFQLLVFFMLTSTFANPSIKLLLPKVSSSNELVKETIVVSIDKNYSIYINGDQTTMDDFQASLASTLKNSKQDTIHIKADQEIPYKYFVQVMDLSKGVGVEQINIVHQKNNEK